MRHLAFALSLLALVTTSLGAPAPARAGLFGTPPFMKNAPAVDPAQLRPYFATGAGVVRGHLSLPGVNYGEEIKLNDEPVYAVPVTDYTRWYFMNYLTKAIKFETLPFEHGDPRRSVLKVDPATFKTFRKTITDKEGRFEFTTLPTGKYYLIAIPNIVISGSSITSGFLGFAVSDFTVREVVLMGDEPGYDIDGGRAHPTKLVRITPHERGRIDCTDSRGRGTDCQKAFDFDQFWGEQSEY